MGRARGVRRAACALLLSALAACGGPEEVHHDPDPVLKKAAAWLWAQQAKDGGWHSETYGLLAPGQALTPFVLGALLEVPTAVALPPEGGVERARQFLTSHVTKDGALGRSETGADEYPCYATALAVRALAAAKLEPKLRLTMQRWLMGQQLADAAGWTESHVAYGAWGMGGVVRTPPITGHIDLSMTRHVLEALAPLSSRHAQVRAVRTAARHFIERVRVRGADPAATQGFFFTTVMGDKNKAGLLEDGRFAPYGSATADGVLALLATGLTSRDAKVQSAVRPLVRHHRTDRTPGPKEFVRSGWARATVFYYRAASARVFAACGIDEAPQGRDWRVDLADALARLQAPDGHFASKRTSMKEDDPLIATALSVRALAAARR